MFIDAQARVSVASCHNSKHAYMCGSQRHQRRSSLRPDNHIKCMATDPDVSQEMRNEAQVTSSHPANARFKRCFGVASVGAVYLPCLPCHVTSTSTTHHTTVTPSRLPRHSFGTDPVRSFLNISSTDHDTPTTPIVCTQIR
jgi:hypothetical protein